MDSTRKHFRKRDTVLKCLRGTETHPSADMLYNIVQADESDISRATVYRNLAYFKENGLIQSLGRINGTERFDGRIDPHGHFVCCSCHTIQNLTAAFSDAFIQEAEAELSCRIQECRIMFVGYCKTCIKSAEQSSLPVIQPFPTENG